MSIEEETPSAEKANDEKTNNEKKNNEKTNDEKTNENSKNEELKDSPVNQEEKKDDTKVESKDDTKEESKDDVKTDSKNDEKSNGKDEEKNEAKEDTKAEAGGDDVMNMLMSYLQKNKDDPKIMQTMLSMMGGKGKDAATGLSEIKLPNSGAKETEGREDKNLSDKGSAMNGKKKDEEESQRNGDKKNKEEKETGNKMLNLFGSKSEKSIFPNFGFSSGFKNTGNETKEGSSSGAGSIFGDGKKNFFAQFGEDKGRSGSDSMNKFGFSGFSGFSGFGNATFGNANFGNSTFGSTALGNTTLGSGKKNEDGTTPAKEKTTQVIFSNGKSTTDASTSKEKDEGTGKSDTGMKKKFETLVEDDDDYIIESAETKEPIEEEAISMIENMNIMNNESGKEKKLSNFDFSKALNNNTTEEVRDVKLYRSRNTWEELNIDNELIQILTYLKFFAPSKIQGLALPYILNTNKNLIAQAQNGSGKTLTFVISMLSKINRNEGILQAMCICPTRELAQQNYDVVGKFTKYLTVKVFLAVPLCDKYNKNEGFQIYVGTPGKTLDLLKRKFVDTKNVSIFVLDEADDLIDIKNNMSSQVESIKRFLPKQCQILLFSATYNEEVRSFADRFAPNASKISVRQEDLTLKCVKQYYLLTENEEQKYYYLSELYCSMSISQCVIFVNSKVSAYNLYQFMTERGHNVTLICADSVISRFTKNQVQKANVLGMDPKTRDTLMSDFKSGVSKVLICTDLLSRGIDVPTISLVINFDLPYVYHGRISENHGNHFANRKVNMETYIHRIGRTGRFGTKGMAINFVSKNQLVYIKQIEQFYQCVISDLEVDSEIMITSASKGGD
ncbi:ATP-dependent RNA helicase DBP5, putative [Plasmodium knowlesi strain H]|uniref:RNA helicase n=3 Tax=Plasmodium knowlesi TaxID=5850 RepID=A0A5K1VKG9_PLAKH|nr:ATP-dependent RNA helicase DBP5, putative [Plasmodium knowlesi strain H]OTN65488.1 putative ATP-dependent RNA helicase DBP5 [Plasmodium knowlesi]CAA9989556.1 ATP-dependent RNA helicase DBP5, putative [Plasmodium knowlesi strain H]SBO22581.1 ATP-dependent RNA helicase DBP5, putative [Plasmodium knowlesi strain H]SBO23513.1 ATP-dependent RNA helicase DBP5, putative [Plasmodium knowlesi strain H]VVS79030.1 ATP-dependent RNA helicase DBP5, putative [Plasmodium knowlesi strain H]|eukprot:XP_002260281.1 DEAD-box RNA helicase, putative [Plasmodium knowlesi strain H]